MSTYFGYAGRILYVDLSSGTARKEPLDPTLSESYLGGMGFNTGLLFEMVGPETDPLCPGNPLLISTGPLTGTLAPASSRVEVTAKSPQSGMLGSSNVGGFWGPVLKYAGYDAIVVTGQASSPVYIWIDDEKVEIRDAGRLWGRDCWETTDLLRREVGERFPHEVRVMSIGPAGENLVRFASIQVDYVSSASRSGMGAVMGSKRLKAIAVRGSGGIRVADPEAFEAAALAQLERIRSDPGFEMVCQPASIARPSAQYNRDGLLPVKNYQAGTLTRWGETHSREAALEYARKSARPHWNGIACHCCPLRCYSWIDVGEGKYAGTRFSGMFFTMILSWGAGCALPDLPAVWKCEELCQRLGLDVVSAAGCVSFAMELFQRGIIGREDLGGASLEWGDDDAAVNLLHKIARREGFGELLAEGTTRAAREIGGDAPNYAMSVKGLEIMNVDPRANPNTTWWLGVITNLRGGDNVKGAHMATFRAHELKAMAKEMGLDDDQFARWFVDRLDILPEVKTQVFGDPPRLDFTAPEGKAAMTKWYEDLGATMDALGLCILDHTMLVTKSGPSYYARLLSACFGREVTAEELVRAGERIVNLQKLFLLRHGATRDDDSWPRRFYDEMLPEDCSRRGPLKREDVTRLLDEYYACRGWDSKGRPTAQTLRRLGLPSSSVR